MTLGRTTALGATGFALCAGMLALSACEGRQNAGGSVSSVQPAQPPLMLAAEPVVSGAVAGRTSTAAGEQSERYAGFASDGFIVTADQPYSTFAADVDTAAYARIRRFLNDGAMPPADLIRIEEMVNYFAYDYPTPEDRYHPFAISTALAPSPWNDRSQLLHVGIQGFSEDSVLRPPLNLVFLVDVSGSMEPADRLPLLQQGLLDLVDVLRPVDRVALVTYASGVEVVLEPTTGDSRRRIESAIRGLRAGGSTNGAGGLEAAYDLAAAHYDPKAVNRVILATDGDFNVGVSGPAEIGDMVAARRDQGVYMTVLGVGTGNLNDALMQAIAQRGDGIAAYVDSESELRRVLSDSTARTLFPIADDVKIQVTFNPALVAEYRLLGYETRAITREQFYDDAADGGDVSAGHSVTAIYEIVPALQLANGEAQIRPASFAPDGVTWASDGVAEIELRYRRPQSGQVEEIAAQVGVADFVAELRRTGDDTRFATAVAGFGLLLRDDPAMLRGFDIQVIADLAAGAVGDDPLGMRREFVDLVRRADRLTN